MSESECVEEYPRSLKLELKRQNNENTLIGEIDEVIYYENDETVNIKYNVIGFNISDNTMLDSSVYVDKKSEFTRFIENYNLELSDIESDKSDLVGLNCHLQVNELKDGINLSISDSTYKSQNKNIEKFDMVNMNDTKSDNRRKDLDYIFILSTIVLIISYMGLYIIL